VTLLFTDIEGSTRLLYDLGDAYPEALADHRRALRQAFAAHGGVEVDTQGDAFFYAFTSATDAAAAADAGQRALGSGPLRVRMGLHTGTPVLTEEGYAGLDVHLGARVAAASHGGQIVLTKATRDLIDRDVRDLGEHRVKDFDGPVWIYQLGDESFPPLKTISNTNLPRPASSFVGREREVIEVETLLREARLVTLTGPGGSGKTRLAIEAASQLVSEFRNGVFWVPLATVREVELVMPTIGQSLGSHEELWAHVAEKEMLLLLDNLEQVAEVAPELAALLEACPNLRLLVTSRELLRVRGEVEYEVLALADPDAVELFCARSGLMASRAVTELCGRLDNLPLALELAAGAAIALTPEQILERLSGRLDLLRGGRDADPRQVTLRTTIEWSYDLLTSEERELFARLSVFAGGCTLEAAEHVVGADLAVLRALVEKSLVRRSGTRFWMLETIREFADEQREKLGNAKALEQRHSSFFLQLARDGEAGERGPDQAGWWNRLEDELDNLRLSLDRARLRGHHLEELELATLLKRFWHARGHLREGKDRIEEALARASGAPGIARARALSALALYTFYLGGDAATSTELTQEALDLYAAAADTAGVARMTLDLGVSADAAGDKRAAQMLYERARTLARNVGDLRYASFAVHNLANLAFQQADYPLAIELGEESIAAARESGDPSNVQSAALLLAWVLAGAGRPGEARELGLEVLHEMAPIRDHWVSRDALELLAIVEADAGAAARAALLAGLAERFRKETGEVRQSSGERLYRPAVEKAEAILGEERFRQALARGAGLTLPEAVALASTRPGA
jgi:predicted ATPase